MERRILIFPKAKDRLVDLFGVENHESNQQVTEWCPSFHQKYEVIKKM